MAVPTTTNTGINVRIDWIAPYDNSDTILGYNILI
jgi:hypothetical protein